MKKIEYIFSEDEMNTIRIELRDAESSARKLLLLLEGGDVKDEVYNILNNVRSASINLLA